VQHQLPARLALAGEEARGHYRGTQGGRGDQSGKLLDRHAGHLHLDFARGTGFVVP
jgi:hypothetical protein